MSHIRFLPILAVLLLLFCMARATAEEPPRILSPKDATSYKQIFALQADGKWKQADKLIKKLENDILMGYVQFQRYMHPNKYRSTYLELRNWLELYNDYPGARRVYNLARRRKPENYRNPPAPRDTDIPTALENSFHDDPPKNRFKYSDRKLLNTVRYRVHKGNVTSAKNHVEERRKKITKHVYAQALGHIARGYFRYERYAKSIAVADKAHKLVGKNATAAVASWWGGLSAWQQGKYQKAAELFTRVADGEDQDEWLNSAGAFWAGRAYDKLGDKGRADELRKIAAKSKHSFYGLLAAGTLGAMPQIDWQDSVQSSLPPSRLLKISAVKRALALNEAGEGGRAESTLKPVIRRLTAKANGSLLQWTQALDMAHGSYAIGKFLQANENRTVYSALYGEPDWLLRAIDKNGPIDRALVLGFVLQESAFQRRAKSSAGARGVMQLMPATASFINGKRIPRSRRDILFNVETNVSLGQKYMAHLLDDPKIANNLLLMVIAYNAGPGNLNKWRKKIDDDDPLLFIESLPWRETRIYVERVMANIWMYRLRYGQEAPSLLALTKNYWPLYVAQDGSKLPKLVANP